MNKVIDVDKLRELYLSDLKSMQEIATVMGFSVGKIHKEIKINNIPTRPQHQGMLGKKHCKKVCEIISKTHKGKKLGEETKEKIRKAHIKGGIGFKKLRSDGYIAIYFPDHPKSTRDGYILEHVLVAECLLGRWLKDNECVHHINGKRNDNRKENLMVMTKQEHMSLHSKKRWKERKENV